MRRSLIPTTLLIPASLLLAASAQARQPGLTHVSGRTHVGAELGYAASQSDSDFWLTRLDLFGELAVTEGPTGISLFGQAPVATLGGPDDSKTGLGNVEIGAAVTLSGQGWRLPLALSATLATADREDRFLTLVTAPVRVRDVYAADDVAVVRLNASPVLSVGKGRVMLDVGADVPTDDREGFAGHLGVGGALPLTQALELRGSMLGVTVLGAEEDYDGIFEASAGVGYGVTEAVDLNAALSVPLHEDVTEDFPLVLHLGVQASF